MQRIFFLSFCAIIFSAVTSCHKSKGTDPVPITAVTFPSQSDLPYDTSGVAAVFLSEIQYDSVNYHRTANVLFTTWFTPQVSASFIDSASVKANSRTLTKYGRYFMTSVGKFIPKDNFRPDTTVTWVLNGPVGFNLSYTAPDSFPVYKVPLPDSIGSGRNYNIVFNGNTTYNVDYVSVKLLVPVNDSTSTVLLFSGTPGNPVVISDDLIRTLANKKIGIIISVYNHQTIVEGLYKYMFVKEYTYGRNVWFR